MCQSYYQTSNSIGYFLGTRCSNAWAKLVLSIVVPTAYRFGLRESREACEKSPRCHCNETDIWQTAEAIEGGEEILTCENAYTATAISKYLGHHKCQGSKHGTERARHHKITGTQ